MRYTIQMSEKPNHNMIQLMSVTRQWKHL